MKTKIIAESSSNKEYESKCGLFSIFFMSTVCGLHGLNATTSVLADSKRDFPAFLLSLTIIFLSLAIVSGKDLLLESYQETTEANQPPNAITKN